MPLPFNSIQFVEILLNVVLQLPLSFWVAKAKGFMPLLAQTPTFS
jgi:hypothetical protein